MVQLCTLVLGLCTLILFFYTLTLDLCTLMVQLCTLVLGLCTFILSLYASTVGPMSESDRHWTNIQAPNLLMVLGLCTSRYLSLTMKFHYYCKCIPNCKFHIIDHLA